MIKKLFLAIGILVGISVFSQTSVNVSKDEVLEVVDRAATFPGGISAFRGEFAKNVKTRKIKQKGVSRTEVTFVVERDGSISHIKATGNNGDFNEASVNAIKKIKTKWNAAAVNGTLVRCRFKFPATLNIE